jgi:SulP family sulfate permease
VPWLLLAILQGILLAAAASMLMLLARVSRPHVAFRPDPGKQQLFRPRASSRKRSATWYHCSSPGTFLDLHQCRRCPQFHPESSSCSQFVGHPHGGCDLSASPYLDLAGAHMLHELHSELAAPGIALRIVVGPRGGVRDLLRADAVGDKVGGSIELLRSMVSSAR